MHDKPLAVVILPRVLIQLQHVLFREYDREGLGRDRPRDRSSSSTPRDPYGILHREHVHRDPARDGFFPFVFLCLDHSCFSSFSLVFAFNHHIS